MKEITAGELRRRAAISRWWNNPEKIKQRFWNKVRQLGPDDCWPWLAWKNNRGYGCFSFRKKDRPASRVAYILTYGDIPDAIEVCHHCDTPSCCNPAHLFTGTHKENMHDCISKGRKAVLRGEEISRKLKAMDVLEIRRLVKTGVPQTVLAKRYHICKDYVWDLVHRHFWAHI